MRATFSSDSLSHGTVTGSSNLLHSKMEAKMDVPFGTQ